MTKDRFDHSQYLIRRQVFKLFGGAFHIYGVEGELLFYSRQKAFRLKEDIRLFDNESMSQQVLGINARNVIDFSAGYDVVDSTTGDHVGGLRRQGLRSMLRDSWLIIDNQDRQVGEIVEDSMAAALVRRFVDIASWFLPQKYHLTMDGATVATFQQNFNPFVQKITLDFSMDPAGRLDRRLGLAAGVLLCAIEGRQN